ncbi:hypothetical protein J4413_03355 [Candidatus Woesearchaeota archaeon]|nr:hypothetical protein [Candidatus Woesearchaeota archaeon]
MFIIPDGLRVGLEKLTGRLSEEEVDIYDSIKALEEVLRRPASLEVLRMYRQREIPRVYENYFRCEDNTRKVYFHQRIHGIREEFDRRIEDITNEPSVVYN